MFKLIQAALLLLALLSTQTPAATTVRYQHTDILGSVVAETDAAANIISRSHYEPFGKRSAGDKAGISYTGHLQDEDLNLIYMQQRYYDPVIGRFYSNDPVGFTASNPMMFNRYAYANNNPYKYTDPNGRNPALLIRPLPIAPPVGGNVQPHIPGHPGVPSSSGGSPSAPNVPLITTSPITSALVAIAQSVISGSDSSKEQKGQGQPEVGECPSCGGKTTDREGKIAQDHGMTSKEVKNSIHGLKNDANMSNNSNVEVCKDCGEVFP